MWAWLYRNGSKLYCRDGWLKRDVGLQKNGSQVEGLVGKERCMAIEKR
jgi:hypothetical protein